MIDWYFNTNFSNISAIFGVNKLYYQLKDTHKALRSKTHLSLKQSNYNVYVQIKRNIKKIKTIYLERMLSNYILTKTLSNVHSVLNMFLIFSKLFSKKHHEYSWNTVYLMLKHQSILENYLIWIVLHQVQHDTTTSWGEQELPPVPVLLHCNKMSKQCPLQKSMMVETPFS